MIISLYAGGMTVRDIQHHLASTLGTDLSHETIANVTDAVLEEVKAWQLHRQRDRLWARGMTITDPTHVAAAKVLREQFQQPRPAVAADDALVRDLAEGGVNCSV